MLARSLVGAALFIPPIALLGSCTQNDHAVVSPARSSVEAESPPPSTHAASSSTSRTPVVVELFSSEGCSSCPPADEVLRTLDATQPIDGALVIPLELHVDYWNDLDWADPFSAPSFSARQQGYASRAGRNGVFTPEAIVDGHASIVGSNVQGLTDLVRGAARAPHIHVEVTIAGESAHIAIGEGVPPRTDLWFALTEVGLETHVAAGENRGRLLRHAPVVRRLERVGEATPGAVDVPLRPQKDTGVRGRAVALLTAASDGSIVGAGSTDR